MGQSNFVTGLEENKILQLNTGNMRKMLLVLLARVLVTLTVGQVNGGGGLVGPGGPGWRVAKPNQVGNNPPCVVTRNRCNPPYTPYPYKINPWPPARCGCECRIRRG